MRNHDAMVQSERAAPAMRTQPPRDMFNDARPVTTHVYRAPRTGRNNWAWAPNRAFVTSK